MDSSRQGMGRAEAVKLLPEDTRERILAVATELVALHGPQNVTIRELARTSGTNIAAVNYHFGSKGELVQEVLLKIFEPINRQRMEILASLEAACAPRPVEVAEILQALLRPVVECKVGSDGGSLYLRALQHLRAYPGGAHNIFVFSTFDSVAQHFIDRLQTALPAFTRAEIIWRYELVRGAAIHMLSNCDPISGKFRHLARGVGMIDIDDKEVILRELLDFSVAGFAAPASWAQEDLKEYGKG